jgi:methionine-rich copper-binding protein CopC
MGGGILMRNRLTISSIMLVLMAFAVGAQWAHAQKGFKVVTGKVFDEAVPQDFYLEGNTIPTQKRNAALLITPSGHRLVVALLDTSGYSSRVQQKYTGMLINEGPVVVCGKQLEVGSYGMGLKMPPPQSDADADFFLYNLAGQKVCQCAVKKDNELKHPTPLQVVLKGEKEAILYLGRYGVPFKP